MKKICMTLFILFSLTMYTWSFEWPQNTENDTPVVSWFGEDRGSSFCSALLFSDSASITASDDGLVLITLGTFSNEDGHFDGTLGNTVILTHANQIDTVYGNLVAVDITDDISIIKAGANLGTSGSSGWQNGGNSLEFQVLDTKLNAIINPLLLLQKKDIEKDFAILNLEAINGTTGDSYKILKLTNMPAGIYSLYCNSKEGHMPFGVTVSINGIVAETVSYDTLTLQENRLCVFGKKPRSYEDIYPKQNRFMLAEIILSHGKNSLTITTSNSNKNEKTSSYNLQVQ